MMAHIGKTMEKAINKQINSEFYSAYLYLSMAAYFGSRNLSGFSAWMRAQAKEEESHALRFYDYVVERGGGVILSRIENPPSEWKSPLHVFEKILEHEQKVTTLIYDLFRLAKENDDPASEVFLQWFIAEQVEEESSAEAILEKLRMVGDSGQALSMLDSELGKRGKE